jgi:DNA end-binding protein Ku
MLLLCAVSPSFRLVVPRACAYSGGTRARAFLRPEESPVASSVWKGYLTFGLISIPIRLFTAARTERISFNQIHSVCKTRIRQPLFCPTCNRGVQRNEIVKGYEYEKDQYVLFNDEELKRGEPESARSMEILQFVKLEEVDPLYLDSSYYSVPEPEGKKAYQLLLEAMEKSGYGALAKVTMFQREQIVLVRPHAKGLTLHTLFYANEVRQVSEYGHTEESEVKDAERKLALQLVESLAAPFEPDKFHDEYQVHLRTMIDAKLQGKEVAEAPQVKRAPVIDLMQALKSSLAQKQAEVPSKKPPLRAVPVTAPAERKAGRKKSTG